jgi:mannose-6-phosphate isomerase-like protein (cupin superfamily)
MSKVYTDPRARRDPRKRRDGRAREFNIAPGDMVMIPRNTAHFMDPGSSRLGYLLMKICD